MEWFRVYHGICADPKLHRLANAAGVRRSVVIACWIAVLETASTRAERGTIGDLDGEALGFMVGESKAVGTRILGLFQDRGMLTADGRVSAWDRRQRVSDDTADRKRRQREREQNREKPSLPRVLAKDEIIQLANPLVPNETAAQSHVTVTPRTEHIGEDSKTPPVSPSLPLSAAQPPQPKAKPKRDASRKSRIPDGFTLTPDMRAFASEKLGQRNVDGVFAQFRDYHQSKGTQHVDWVAAWRFWVRNERPSRAPPPPPRATIDGTMRILHESGLLNDERPEDEPDSGGLDAAPHGLPFYGLN